MAKRTNVASPKRSPIEIIDTAVAGLMDKAEQEQRECKYMPIKGEEVCEITNLLTTVAASILRVRAEILHEEEVRTQYELIQEQRSMGTRVQAVPMPRQRQNQSGRRRQALSV